MFILKVHFKRLISSFLAVALSVSMLAVSASAEWNSTVGYYGSVTMEMLEEKLVFENKQLDENFLTIGYDSDLGAYRLQYINDGTWYLNTEGTFPYVLATLLTNRGLILPLLLPSVAINSLMSKTSTWKTSSS